MQILFVRTNEEGTMPTIPIFLHGLDSSIQGTKGRWFARHFPAMRMQDYSGSLEERLAQLRAQCQGLSRLVLVGSSFGALMATCHAIRYPAQCERLILLAPALNFAEFAPPAEKILTPTRIIIGRDDVVTPPALVLPLAERTFAAAEIDLVEDDHMLHRVFSQLDWPTLLA